MFLGLRGDVVPWLCTIKPSLLNQIVRSSCSLMFHRLKTSRKEAQPNPTASVAVTLDSKECQWLSDSLAHLGTDSAFPTAPHINGTLSGDHL